MKQLIVNVEDNKRIKIKLAQNKDLQEALILLADQAMSEGPWSVTDYIPSRSKDPHCYYSEAPYWWPNPENPDGPYIRRDGEFNKDHFSKHKLPMRQVCKNVLILCSASYHLDNKSYMDKAIELIKVWFLNEESYMAPHLEFAQAIPGISKGRGIGIIDTICFIELLQGVAYIEELGLYEEEVNGLRTWFEAFLDWMCSSDKGIDEKMNGNNHATWWTTQVAVYGSFTGNKIRVEEAFDWYKHVILPEQMAEDGSFPEELARTRSYHYTHFNLLPIILLAEVAYHQNVDLWHYKLDDGRCLEKGIEYLAPFVENPSRWQYPSIDPLVRRKSIIWLLTAKRLNNKIYEDIIQLLDSEKVKQDENFSKMMLPLCIWT